MSDLENQMMNFICLNYLILLGQQNLKDFRQAVHMAKMGKRNNAERILVEGNLLEISTLRTEKEMRG